MNVLDTLLQPVASMINRQVGAKTPARELCAALDGHAMAVRVSNTALAVFLVAGNDRLILSSACDNEPDVVIEGSLLALARLAGPEGEAAIRGGDIDLSGDALLAQQFRKLLAYGRPDFEDELALVVGDVAAHGIGDIVRGIGAWGREARSTMTQNLGEYLQEESRTVPTRDEVDAFRGQVDALRDDVARFEARLSAIEPRAETQDTA